MKKNRKKLRDIIPSSLLSNSYSIPTEMSVKDNMARDIINIQLIEHYFKNNVWSKLEKLIEDKILSYDKREDKEESQELKVSKIIEEKQAKLEKIREARLFRQKNKQGMSSWTLEEKQKIINDVQLSKVALKNHALYISGLHAKLNAEARNIDDIEKYLNELLTKKDKEDIQIYQENIENNKNVISEVKPTVKNEEEKRRSFLTDLKRIANEGGMKDFTALVLNALGPWVLAIPLLLPFFAFLIKFGIGRFIALIEALKSMYDWFDKGGKDRLKSSKNKKGSKKSQKSSKSPKTTRFKEISENLNKFKSSVKEWSGKVATKIKDVSIRLFTTLSEKFTNFSKIITEKFTVFKETVSNNVRSTIQKWEEKFTNKPSVNLDQAKTNNTMDFKDAKNSKEPKIVELNKHNTIGNGKLSAIKDTNINKPKITNIDDLKLDVVSFENAKKSKGWAKTEKVLKTLAEFIKKIAYDDVLKNKFLIKLGTKVGGIEVAKKILAKLIAGLSGGAAGGPLGLIFLLWTIFDTAAFASDVYDSIIETMDEVENEEKSAKTGSLSWKEFKTNNGYNGKIESWGEFSKKMNSSFDSMETVAGYVKNDKTKNENNNTLETINNLKPQQQQNMESYGGSFKIKQDENYGEDIPTLDVSDLETNSIVKDSYGLENNTLVNLIKLNEGYNENYYPDAHGYSIGYGHFSRGDGSVPVRNILGYEPVNGRITREEAEILLEYDLARAKKDAYSIYPWITQQPVGIQNYMVDMSYNLGGGGFAKFASTMDYIRRGDYATAARRLENSSWYKQTGNRAKRFVNYLDQVSQGKVDPNINETIDYNIASSNGSLNKQSYGTWDSIKNTVKDIFGMDSGQDASSAKTSVKDYAEEILNIFNGSNMNSIKPTGINSNGRIVKPTVSLQNNKVDTKTEIATEVQNQINNININQAPVTINTNEQSKTTIPNITKNSFL